MTGNRPAIGAERLRRIRADQIDAVFDGISFAVPVSLGAAVVL